MLASKLLRRGLKGLLILVTILALLFAGGVLWLLTRSWADLRTDQMRRQADQTALAAKGRALLERVAEASGLSAYETHQTFTVIAKDEWAGSGPWWPGPVQEFRADRLLNTFTSRVKLRGGQRDGEIWGIQSWSAYKIPKGTNRPTFARERAIEFYLPTLQYFDELPFRLRQAPIALDAGQGLYLGRKYQRVFVTWGDPKPHRKHDQYDLWIDPKSGLIAVARYTLRDAVDLSGFWMRPIMKAFAAGTIHFQDYRSVGGVQIPFRSIVTLAPPDQTKLPLDQNFFHRVTVEHAAFDEVEPSTLIIDTELPAPADVKPAS
jgi:hypothetical protein